MPKIKTKRKENLVYAPEYQAMCDKAKEEVGSWLSAWIAFDWIFGKRRNEISKLIRKDIWQQGGYLYVRFYVGKKQRRTALVEQLPYTKRKTLNHKATAFILQYLDEYDKQEGKPEGYIFPSSRQAKNLTVKTAFINKQGEKEIRSYTYDVQGGYIDPALVYYYIRKVNPKFWPHLGRHTVATLAAEEGATEYDISNILDVSPRTASKYVHHGTKLTEKWSERTE